MPRRPPPRTPRQAQRCRAFSLLEILVAVAILVGLIVLLASIFQSTANIWIRSGQRIDAFRDARSALRFMADDLRGAIKQSAAPCLVLQNIFVEDDPAGLANNQQIYALATAANDGHGDICSVGYYCAWDKDARAYVLMRAYSDSDRTFERMKSLGKIGRSNTPSSVFTPGADSPYPDERIAEYVWNLKVTPIDETGAVLQPSYPVVFNQYALPAALEISFDAVSPQAVQALRDQKIVSDFWFAPESHIYRSQIAPKMQRFRTRVELTLGGPASEIPPPPDPDATPPTKSKK